MRGILWRPSWSSYRRPLMTVIHEMTSWSMQRCNRKQRRHDRYNMANRFTHQQTQPIQKKEKKRKKIAVVLVDTRTGRDLWLWFSPAFYINMSSIRQSFVASLCHFVNRFLASKPSNGFRSKTVRNVHIWASLRFLLRPLDGFISSCVIHVGSLNSATSMLAAVARW